MAEEGEFNPDDIQIIIMYMKFALRMMSEREFMKTAVDMGYNVHGSEGNDHADIPDLTKFMPEIADDFEAYLRKFLPEIPGIGSDFSEERIDGIVAEVRDNLLEDPPNMAGVLDLANELNFADEVKDQIMSDMKNYMNKLLGELLDSMGYPAAQRDQAVVSMSYALGSLSDEEYM